jgi:regulator of protease activity HflC (stomatin/prohibitin superfamily)
MLEKLLDLLEKVWTIATPIVIMHPWQGVVITRLGRVRRVKDAFYWPKWPLLEDYHLYEACETTMRLPAQSLTTKDDRAVVVSSIVKYEIRDGAKYVRDVWDAKDALADVAAGAIADWVEEHTYEEWRSGSAKAELLTKVRRGTSKYGFQINALTFPDNSRTRSLRLMMPGVTKDLDN